MTDRITYVGLDVHREAIVVTVGEGGRRGEVREYGRVAKTATALDRLLSKLGGEGVSLRFCYERRRGRTAMASNVTCRGTGTNASWWRHR